MQVCIVGGGMITHDQLLPSLYQLQREGVISSIMLCARRRATLRALHSTTLSRVFPKQSFQATTQSYREAIAALPPRQIVAVAVPDHLHYEVILAALEHDQHVLCVKPLVLQVRQSLEIQRKARARGLLVAVDYHKRFDDRSLLARRLYREGAFGEFRLGHARLFEKWHYRHSNFQKWMTAEHSDAFTYIGCHYVDLVAFITGLLPAAVSVYGVRDRFPNRKEAFLWTDARVIWNNGACLNVQNGLGYPDDAPGANTQGLTLYCAGRDQGALLEHSDQYRGLKYSFIEKPDVPGATIYAEPSPDYFQYVDGVPVGYGYRSIERIVTSIINVESHPKDRAKLLAEIHRAGIIATATNSSYNDKVIEAARRSIVSGGKQVRV